MVEGRRWRFVKLDDAHGIGDDGARLLFRKKNPNENWFTAAHLYIRDRTAFSEFDVGKKILDLVGPSPLEEAVEKTVSSIQVGGEVSYEQLEAIAKEKNVSSLELGNILIERGIFEVVAGKYAILKRVK
jgi:hypothetical protein